MQTQVAPPFAALRKPESLMRHIATSLLTLPLALAVAACGPVPGGDLNPVQPRPDVVTELNLFDFDENAYQPTGVSVDPRTGDLVFIHRGGILIVDQQGNEVSRLATEGYIVGENEFGMVDEDGNLIDREFYLSDVGDIAALGDGTYALPMENMVRRFDPNTGRAEDYYCLLPAMEIQTMHNDAIALNLSDDEIVGAPVITEDTTIVSNNLVRYRVSTAEFEDAHNLGNNLFAKGLAFTPDERHLLAVEGSTLSLLTRDGHVLATHELIGIESASGLALLPEENLAYVLDEQTSTLKAFHLDAMLSELQQ